MQWTYSNVGRYYKNNENKQYSLHLDILHACHAIVCYLVYDTGVSSTQCCFGDCVVFWVMAFLRSDMNILRK